MLSFVKNLSNELDGYFVLYERRRNRLDHLVGLVLDLDNLLLSDAVSGNSYLHHSHRNALLHIGGDLLTTHPAQSAGTAAPRRQEHHHDITLDADLLESFHGHVPDAEQVQHRNKHSTAAAEKAARAADGIVDLTGGDAAATEGHAAEAPTTGLGTAVEEAGVEVTRLEHDVLLLRSGLWSIDDHGGLRLLGLLLHLEI